MPVYGPNSAGSGASVSPGPGDDALGSWLNTGNITSSDDSRSNTQYATGGSLLDQWAYLTKGGTATVGSNQAAGGTLPGTDAYVSIGGSSSLWDTTLTEAEVEASTFGAMYAVQANSGIASRWLVATNFGFAIGTGETIDGVLFEVERSKQSGEGHVDHVRATVYTSGGGGGGSTQPVGWF